MAKIAKLIFVVQHTFMPHTGTDELYFTFDNENNFEASTLDHLKAKVREWYARFGIECEFEPSEKIRDWPLDWN